MDLKKQKQDEQEHKLKLEHIERQIGKQVLSSLQLLNHNAVIGKFFIGFDEEGDELIFKLLEVSQHYNAEAILKASNNNEDEDDAPSKEMNEKLKKGVSFNVKGAKPSYFG